MNLELWGCTSSNGSFARHDLSCSPTTPTGISIAHFSIRLIVLRRYWCTAFVCSTKSFGVRH
jgi:hypothetical protein